jgi:hypothetical protein
LRGDKESASSAADGPLALLMPGEKDHHGIAVDDHVQVESVLGIASRASSS